jgi:FAD/FMN-containing dehydrogenase
MQGSCGRVRSVGSFSKTSVVNDVHSQLNATRVAQIVRPRSLDDLSHTVTTTRDAGGHLSIAGGRHAMGGQQFASGATLVDTTGLDRVLRFDRAAGLIEVQAGIQWPALVRFLHARQPLDSAAPAWSIAQKQTGADRLSLGGALAANIHGRGLRMKPFVGDIESFVLVDADGRPRTCSRSENPDLFRLAVGGYGLFGLVYSVKLRLARRRKLRRVVVETTADELAQRFDQRIADGFEYGDFQFAIDDRSDDFLRRGIMSCYEPVSDETPMPAESRELRERDWCDLIHLAHTEKSRAYRRYADYYLSTSGQLYWSDLHQLSTYIDDYHASLNCGAGIPPAAGGTPTRASEVITELYVPRPQLASFLRSLRAELRDARADVIYGTVRLIERDDETFLPWAKQSYACVVLNLHVNHAPPEVARAADTFRRLIDVAIAFDGSYYLTYHKWATPEQVEACYPQFRRFLELKKEYDPDEVFQSNWYRHYREAFAPAHDAHLTREPARRARRASLDPVMAPVRAPQRPAPAPALTA